MLINDVRIIFAFTGLATQIRGQTSGPDAKLQEISISQSGDIVEEVNSTDLKIRLLHCCPENGIYRPFLDTCPDIELSNETELALEDMILFILSKLIKLLILPHDTSQRIELTSGSIFDCPDGYFGNSTTEFKLLDDGSLRNQRKTTGTRFILH